MRASLRMGRSADTQAANQPDKDGNDQYQAKNAAKAGPAIPAVTIVAAASEQQNQQDDNQNCTHVTPSLKFQFILEVSVYGFRPSTSEIPPHLEAQEAADDPPSITLLGRLLALLPARTGKRAKHLVR